MRKLIHELLEPHIHRGMEDRDFTTHLKKSVEVQKRRIAELEYAVFKSNATPAAFEEITLKFQETVSASHTLRRLRGKSRTPRSSRRLKNSEEK